MLPPRAAPFPPPSRRPPPLPLTLPSPLQWVYDTWWSALTPDRQFPAEVRRLANALFGEICERARRPGVRNVLVR